MKLGLNVGYWGLGITPELRSRPGWAWLRVFRRLDEWEAAVARAEEKPRESETERELERV